MAGNNALSFKECIYEANPPAQKEMQYTHWKFSQVYTQYLLLTLLIKTQGTTKRPHWILQIRKQESDLLDSVVHTV